MNLEAATDLAIAYLKARYDIKFYRLVLGKQEDDRWRVGIDIAWHPQDRKVIDVLVDRETGTILWHEVPTKITYF